MILCHRASTSCPPLLPLSYLHLGSLLLQSPRIDVADVRGIFPAVPEQPRSIVRLPLIIKEVPVAVENRSSSSRPTCKQPNHLPVRLNPLARKPLTRHGKSFSP